MHRYDYFYEQVVTDAELDAGFTGAEDADHALAIDHGLFGVATGLGVGQHGVGDLTVDVAGGAAYDQTGQRIAFPATENLDVSEDHTSTPTTVAGAGNERYVAVFVKFKRVESDPRPDGHGTTIQYNRAEGHEFYVTMGAEAVIPTATPPALESDAVLLADIHLINGQVQVLTADIDLVTRRQSIGEVEFVGRYPIHYLYGQWPAAVASLASAIDAHISGSALKHEAVDIKTTVVAGAPYSLTTANLDAQLNELLDAVNYAPCLAWGTFNQAGVLSVPSRNVFSVVKEAGNGHYTVTIANGPTALISVQATAVDLGGGTEVVVVPTSTTVFAVYTFIAGAATDLAVAFAVFGA